MRWRPILSVPVVAAMLLATAPLRFTASVQAEGANVFQAQKGRSVSVSVQPPAVTEIALLSENADKLLTTTDQNGKSSFDGSPLANLGNLTITEETCAKRRRVLLVASNAKAPRNRECKITQLGTFVGSKGVELTVRLSGSFTAAIGAVPIPEPPQATPSPSAVQRPTPAQASQPPAAGATAAARPCPPGASMVGAKLDLSPDADSFEKAPLLVPCVYRGVEDTGPDKWKYYKLEIKAGQTLRVTARLRDSELPPRPNFGTGNRLTVRVHDGNGGVSQVQAIPEASGIYELEYKAKESGFVFVSVSWIVRDAAFQISVQ